MEIQTFIALLSLITLYSTIKEIRHDIQHIRSKRSTPSPRNILWQHNKKLIFSSLALFIFFSLLSIALLLFAISSFIAHDIILGIFFSVGTILFLYYTIILLISIITRITLILQTPNQQQ